MIALFSTNFLLGNKDVYIVFKANYYTNCKRCELFLGNGCFSSSAVALISQLVLFTC